MLRRGVESTSSVCCRSPDPLLSVTRSRSSWSRRTELSGVPVGASMESSFVRGGVGEHDTVLGIDEDDAVDHRVEDCRQFVRGGRRVVRRAGPAPRSSPRRGACRLLSVADVRSSCRTLKSPAEMRRIAADCSASLSGCRGVGPAFPGQHEEQAGSDEEGEERDEGFGCSKGQRLRRRARGASAFPKQIPGAPQSGHMLLTSTFEAVADSADGDYARRSRRVGLYLFTEPAHVHVHRADVAYIVVSPQLFEYLVPSECAAWIPHEEREQIRTRAA